MHKISRFFILVLLGLIGIQCAPSVENVVISDTQVKLIPAPDSLSMSGSFSTISEIRLDDVHFWNLHKSWLETYPIAVKLDTISSNLKMEVDSSLLPLQYILNIGADRISIYGHTFADIRNGFISLLQLLQKHERLPMLHIEDRAEFDYRGMHLDVGRHMFDIEDIKQYIDFLTYYKYNRFHWHLTEDQGWRIEIPSYPKLQEIAAFRKETLVGHYNDQPHEFDQTKYGGFYTQLEIREIVAYADARGVEVIPEIEMPGHAQAAIAAYPEFGCTGDQIDVATKWGVFPDVFCPNPETFNFLKVVIDDVVDLFPSSYIHIGGDECPKDQWKASEFCQDLMRREGIKDEYELQSYFIGVIADYIQSKGKSIIGWDEILEGGLHPSATVMSWRGTVGAVAAVKEGHKAIMTPGSHCYFDHYQSSHPDEPLAIGGLTTLEDVYHFDPIPKGLNLEQRKLIWGVQGNVWTEYMKDFDQVSYMALARMMALSEVQWNLPSERDYDGFLNRYVDHVDFWEAKGVSIANHLLDLDVVVRSSPLGSYALMRMPNENTEVYAVYPAGKSSLKNDSFYLEKDGAYSFFAEYDGQEGRQSSIDFKGHLGNKASIDLENLPSKTYAGSGKDALVNGIAASEKKYGGPEWLGFSGKDLIATIGFEESSELSNITIQFFKGEGQWIYLPRSIDISVSEDGLTYSSITAVNKVETEGKMATVSIPLETEAKFVRITARKHGIIEQGRQGAGHQAWLFVGEIILE